MCRASAVAAATERRGPPALAFAIVIAAAAAGRRRQLAGSLWWPRHGKCVGLRPSPRLAALGKISHGRGGRNDAAEKAHCRSRSSERRKLRIRPSNVVAEQIKFRVAIRSGA